MTIFFPDVSGHQYRPETSSDLSLKGALAACIKVTEGTTYVNPAWRRARSDARKRGAYAFGYHMLHHGAGAAEARHYRAQTTMPCMVDVELGGANIADTCDFVDELRRLGGRVFPIYLPHWYWQSPLGSPDLKSFRDRSLFLWSSAYTGYTDSDSGVGWQPYGGMTPEIWQYTSTLRFNGQSVDFSAYRGKYAGKQDPASIAACLADFESLVETGHVETGLNPVQNFRVTKRGFTGFNVAWDAEHGATSYTAHAKRTDGTTVRTVETTKTSCRLGLLHPGRDYVLTVRAHPAHSTGKTAVLSAKTKG